MTARLVLSLTALLTATVVTFAVVASFRSATALESGASGAAPTATPCPPGKVPDTFGGSGCGTPTPTPTSVRPPPVPDLDITANGEQGPVTVTAGDVVKFEWVLRNLGERPFDAEVDTSPIESHGTCFVNVSASCSASMKVAMGTPGSHSQRVHAVVRAPQTQFVDYVLDIEDSVTVQVILLGDTNCDLVVSSIDALLILQLSVALIQELPCGVGDVDGDGFTNAIDAALVLQYVAELISSFP